MHATVVVFPGSNADAEMVHTLRDVVQVRTSVAWHRDAELPAGTELVAIPGGFSYGDYLRCGAIAKVSPIVAAIRRHAERGGHVLGVCNGFQILTEAGLLPGALTRNAHLRFECRDVFVTKVADGPFARRPAVRPPAPDRPRRRPLPGRARGAGGAGAGRQDRPPLLRRERRRHARGEPERLDGVDRRDLRRAVAKNVFGLMPHPERMSDAARRLRRTGASLFDAVVRAVAGRPAGRAS
jgi:phosphoribosylformylglycinamidine (FGAM) synthase-like amidotransferase family enzyme